MAATRALADEPEPAEDVKVEPVVVTATRTPEPLSSIVQPIELITEQEIHKAGQDTLTGLLQQQANVEVTGNGGFGQPSGVFLRGSNSSHTLVLDRRDPGQQCGAWYGALREYADPTVLAHRGAARPVQQPLRLGRDGRRDPTIYAPLA